MVFPDAPIAHLGKSEDALQDAKRMLDPGSHSSLGRVLALGLFVNIVLVSGPAASHILCLGRGGAHSPSKEEATLQRGSSTRRCRSVQP